MLRSAPLKTTPQIDRPREKLIRYGAQRLSSAELLAILLGTGKRGENVVAMAGKILQSFGPANLPKAKCGQLSKFNGLGPAKACAIVAAFELSQRLLENRKSRIYLSAKDVWEELKEIRALKKEHFVVLFLNSRNQEIKKEIVALGTVNSSIIHPREVFEPAVKNLAGHIICAHNHPSNDPSPSQNDIELTKRLEEAGKILGIELADHVIVAKDSYFSFRKEGLLAI